MKRVTAIGYGNCDLIYTGLGRLPEEGEEVYSRGFGMYLGGGASATLIALSRLGVPVMLNTFLGNDPFSQFLERELIANKVNYRNLYQGSRVPVTISSIFNTENDRTIVSYLDDFVITDNMKTQIKSEMEQSDFVIMHQGFYDIYEQLDRSGKIMVFDTSWGNDMSLDYFEPYFELADYCTPNEKESLAVTGAATPEKALDVLGRYFEVPIIKTGEQGCIYKKHGQIGSVPALPDIKPVDYTGAGDAFLAGFLYGIFQNKPVEQSILFGNVTGGLSVQETGCVTNCITEDMLLEHAGKINKIMGHRE